ncbi:hypothetical protein K488DRAFT_21456, partial [Vararia minispora EC-137]
LSPSPSPSPPSVPLPSKSTDDFVFRSPPAHRSRPSCKSAEDIRARKRRLGRRITLSVLVVPLALVIITLSTRYLTHPAVFDIFSGANRQPLPDLTGWHDASTHEHARRGQVVVSTAMQASTVASSLIFPSASGSSAASTTPSTTSTGVPKIPPTAPTLPTPFPQPFDTTLSSNFSSSGCSAFFSNMTSTLPFRQCRAFSFLSQVSTAFLTAQSNISALNIDVWGTCNTPESENQCTANMAWFEQALRTECAQDLSDQNAMIVQSLQSLQLYDLLRQAACLADANTGAYCYVEAAASSNPFDLYLYSLPFGISVPASATPSCSTCAQSVMAIFQAQAKSFDGLKTTYNGAATRANSQCGTGY